MLDVRYGNILDSPHLVMENPFLNVNHKHNFIKYVMRKPVSIEGKPGIRL